MTEQATSPPNRVDRRKERTRSALLRAARRLLAEDRTNVSIQEITDAADVGFGLLQPLREQGRAIRGRRDPDPAGLRGPAGRAR